MPIPVVSSLFDPIVSPTVNQVLSWAINEIGNIVNVNQTLSSLMVGIENVQYMLDLLDRQPDLVGEQLDLQDRQLKVVARSWESWVGQFTDLCYKVEDIIDEVILAEMKRRYRCDTKYSKLNPLRWFQHSHDDEVPWDPSIKARKYILSNATKLVLPREIATLLSQLNRIEDQVNRMLLPVTLQRRNLNNDPVLHRNPTDPGLLLPEGRNTDKNNIMQKLLAGTVAGVSIIGMAGLGKSVLARSIADDPTVRDHFHDILWHCPKRHLYMYNNSEPVILYSSVPSKDEPLRTLVVFDHLGEVPANLEDWETFMSRYNHPNQTLLITTRDPMVVLNTRTTPYYLRRMSEEDCEELIRSRVLQHVDLSEYDRVFFDRQARFIARKCMGLPLAASTLGIALVFQCQRLRPYEAIRTIARSGLWERHGEEILRKMRLNNPKLPSHLNKLLAYFTLFPHDQLVSKDNIVQLWMAEGFIQPERWEDMEQDWHFDTMVPMCMIEPMSSNHEEHPSAYRTNEINDRFAESITSNRCFRMEGDDPSFPNFNARHLSICSKNIEEQNLFKEITERFTSLRTLLLLHKNGSLFSDTSYELLFRKLMCLRVLDLSRSCITYVPVSICHLKHLRYLDFSYTCIEVLPGSICKLFGLRILKLFACSKLQYLPKKIGDLVNLVCLELGLTCLCVQPRHIGKLTKLQNLHAFIVKKGEGYCITELKNMDKLQGSLKIMELENVKDGEEAAKAALYKKIAVRSLVLQWTNGSLPEPSEAEGVFSRLQPHEDLEELRVENYGGSRFPIWISSTSCCLQIIRLHNFPRSTELPPLWKLPLLRVLHIGSFPQLQNVGREFIGGMFRFLEYLEFSDMPNLLSWGEELVPSGMPGLKELKFVDCHVLENLPSLKPLKSLTTLEIVRCTKLKNRPDTRLETEIRIMNP